MMVSLPVFSKKVKYTVAETVIIKIADWAVKQDRADLCLCIYSLALGANLLSEGFEIPQRHQNFISDEFPSAFLEGVSIEFSVLITEEEQ